MALFGGRIPSDEFSRLGFKADVIEPLGMKAKFRILTPEGTFEMTKADFVLRFRERRVFYELS